MKNTEAAKDLHLVNADESANVVEFTDTLRELRKHVDPNLVRQREGWRDRNGNVRTVDYIEWHTVADILDETAPNWAHSIKDIRTFGDVVAVTVAININGVTREGIGTGNANSEMGIKKAEHDALKRAAVKFGIARDLYKREFDAFDTDAVPAAVHQEPDKTQVRELFAAWPSKAVVSPGEIAIGNRSERSMTIVDRPGSAQANIVISNIAIPRSHPDHFAATVMNQVLGAGASSRVFMNLREEKGYTYGAYTRLDAKKLAGDFEATAEVRTAVTGDALKEFFYELDRIRDEKVSDDEIADAKSFLTGVFPIRAETQEGLTGLISNQVLYGLPDDYLQSYRERIDSVTAEDVQKVANAYVRPDIAAMVIVGDAKEILPQVKQFSITAEILDSAGKRKEL